MSPTDSPPQPKRSIKSSPKLAALVALVMLLVATPAVQVWRHYQFQIQNIVQARDATEPLALAVRTQRAVVAHQGHANQLLAGDRRAEANRRQQQTAADNGFSALARSLAVRQFDAALLEAQSATSDWMALLDALSSQQLQAAESDIAHHLVVEQLVQVIDLVSDSAALHGSAGRPLNELAHAQRATAAWLATQALAQAQAVRVRASEPDGQPRIEPHIKPNRLLAASLAQRSRRAEQAWRSLERSAASHPDAALAQAAQQVSLALRQGLEASNSAPALAALGAADSALQRHWHQLLDQQEQALQLTRASWLALIALQACALVATLAHLRRRPVGAPAASPAEGELNFAAPQATALPAWRPPLRPQASMEGPRSETTRREGAPSKVD